MTSAILLLGAFFFLFLMSVVFHELGHAVAALWCGDTTARDLGRITLNPLDHLDPIWSVLLPIATTFLIGLPFGGAKPVPVNPLNFRNPRRDDLIVTLAGPAANVVQAVIYAVLYHLIFGDAGRQEVVNNGLGVVLVAMVFVNILLTIFNLMPVPPLDGSHVLAALLPAAAADAYRRVGFFGILIVLMLLSMTNLGYYLQLGTFLAMDALGLSREISVPAMQEIFNLTSRIGL